MRKKAVWNKTRPKKLGKPKAFNKKSKAYKSAKLKQIVDSVVVLV